MDIADAYPREAGIDSWRRRVTLRRGQGHSPEVVVVEDFKLATVRGPTSLNLMTDRRAVTVGTSAIQLDHVGASPNSPVYVVFDPTKISPDIEVISIEDGGLAGSWGETVTRIVLTLRDEALTSGRLDVRFTLQSPTPDLD